MQPSTYRRTRLFEVVFNSYPESGQLASRAWGTLGFLSPATRVSHPSSRSLLLSK